MDVGESADVGYIGHMKLSKLKLICLFGLISTSAFATWDENQTPESEGQMGSFHNTNSRSPKRKKDLCDGWMNMQSPELTTPSLQPLPAKKMNFTRPPLTQMGDNYDESESNSGQMQ